MNDDAIADDKLVEALRRGEEDAVDALVDRYGGWIHRVARKISQ